jgi:hypothetical protein
MSTAVFLPRPTAAAGRLRFVSKELALWLGLHPVLMAVAVNATGNHDFLDSAAGVAVVLSALVAIHLSNRKER